MAGHPERLVAQRLLFTAPVPEAPEELYARVTEGAVLRERDGITVRPNTAVTTNTYFGRFPASYWQRWTDVKAVQWQARCSGAGEIRVVASDPAGQPRVVHTETVDADAERDVVLEAPLDRFVDGGALWLEMRTTLGELVVGNARWTVPAPRLLRPTAVVMPSYNRVSYCITTLSTLARDREALDFVTAVYLIDQGDDTVESNPDFPSVVEALDGKLRYIRQPNLGGSGGYSRGLHEASTNHGEHVNALFMDDDIWLEPDVVFRLSTFEQHTTKPVIVGGQMLRLLHPDRLHVGAETANLRTLAAGIALEHSLWDANVVEEEDPKEDPSWPSWKVHDTQFQQETRLDAGYNGWWACLVPSEVTRNVGYPMPGFFQWDDIEFGFRARSAGYPTVTLPGAGVWHIDFDWKDWDDWHRYFNIRNALITSALHSPFDQRSICVSLLQQLARYLVSMQYGLAATLLKAVDDFLVGPEIMRDGGVQAAAEIRKLRAEYPETVRYSASEVPGVGFSAAPTVASGRPPMARHLTLAARLLTQLAGRVHGSASIPANNTFWWHLSQFETVVVTDASQEGVRVRHLDQDRLRQLGAKGISTLVRLYREGPKVAGAYRRAMPELTSRENWQRLYDSV
jgi:galactofuranosylgalactofuranosylrhamnosyl-N-acetylglucosaminyl-diphospho-decaprenol beta-1,5/1,6-galactofuranosyltransferase